MYIQSYNSCNAGEAKYTKDYLTRGGKIFLAYLLIVYIFPLLINLAYDSEPIFRLPIGSESVLLSVLLLISVSILAIAISRYTPTVTPRNKGPIKPLPKWLIVLFCLIAISVGYSVFSAGLSQWRYTTSISGNSTVLYASVVQTIMPVMSFWVLMTDHQFILSRFKSDIFIKGLIFLGLVFSINGFGNIFVTLLFALVFIAPQSMMSLLFKDSSNNNKKFYRYLGIGIILPIVSAPLFMAGVFAKSGSSDADYSLEEMTLAHTGLNYLINRHSVHIASLAASIEDGSNSADLSIITDTAEFRFKVITGLNPEAQKPDVASFSRLSLLQFADFRNINPKGGSSPGLFAALTMVLPLPLAVLSVFLATFFLVKFLDFILCRQPPFSFIGAIIFAYIPFKYPTDSPFDLFIPGPVTIALLLVVLLSLRRQKLSIN
tara:strand:+ start:303 stop:1598 length:1296 start_codon:yes stop_codon:yes gene_type:complete